MKKVEHEDHFIIRFFKSFFPQIIYYVVGAVIAFVILRTDVAALTKRVDALESSTANRDVVQLEIGALEDKIDTGFKHVSDSMSEIKGLLYTHMGAK
jgi:hypothetical protein